MADNLDKAFESLDDSTLKQAAPPSLDDAFAYLDDNALKQNPPQTWTQKVSAASKSAYDLLNKGFEKVTGTPIEGFNSELNRTIDEIGGVPGATDAVLNTVGDIVEAPFKVLTPALDAASKTMGTGLAYSIDGYRGMLGLDSIVERKRLQDLDAQLKANRDENGNPISKVVLDTKSLPVRLADLARDPTNKYMLELAQNLESSNNPAVQEIGQWVNGFRPATAEAMGLAAEIYGLPIPKVGRLTEAGTKLAKEDALSMGIAQQISKGERAGLEAEFKIPGLGEANVPLVPSKLAAKTVDKLQNLAMDFEASKPGQFLSKYTTLPSLPVVGRSGQELAYAENFIDSQQKDYAGLLKNRAEQLGIDMQDPSIRKRFQTFIENPTHVKDPLGEQFETLYQNAYKDLQGDVEQARSMGILINDKFENLTIGPVRARRGFQERYVPRYPEQGNVQLKQMTELLGDQEKATQAVEDLGLADAGVKKGSTAFKLERSPLNTAKMNQLIEEKTGVKNFFSDDPLDAFARKRAEIQRAVERKKFLDGIMSTAGQSKEDWVLLRNNAAERVQQARAAGQIPDLMDLKLSKVDLSSLEKVGVGGEEMSNILLPKSDADFVRGMIKAPDRNAINAYINSYMRAWKGATFFNPGFVGRNAWENYTRAMQAGVTTTELAKGQAAYIFNKGNWSKYVDEFNSYEKQLGLASDVQKSAGAKVVAPIAAETMENPLDRTMSTLHEMSMRGKVKDFFNVSKRLEDVANNPLFRVAKSVNNGAENSFKFAYYAKLREEGYSVKAALKSADDAFLSYNLVRNSVANAQAYVPFLNYMVKNAETTAKLFMKNPRGLVTFAPGGALERAIEHWSDWDPNQVEDFKKIHGEYYSDRILGPILPGKDAMMKEQDYVKRFLNSWLNPNGDMAGFQMWSNLPSNYHGLMSMDPRRANQMMGPALKMGLILATGVDPSTGNPIVGANDQYIAPTQRVLKALDEATGAFIPDRVINAARYILNQKMPEAREKFINQGLSPEMIDTILGPDNKKYREQMQKAFLAMKTLYMGTATKVDVDIMVRQQAEMQRLQKDLSQMMTGAAKRGNSKELQNSITRAKNLLLKSAKDLVNFVNIKQDYDKRVDAIGGTPEENVEFKDIIDETINPQRFDREDDPTPEEMQKDSIDGAFNKLTPEIMRSNEPVRMPASEYVKSPNEPLNQMWDARAKDIIKKYNLDLNKPQERQFLDDMLRNYIKYETPSLPEIMQDRKHPRETT